MYSHYHQVYWPFFSYHIFAMCGEVTSSIVFVVRLIVCQSYLYRVVGNRVRKSDCHHMHQGTLLQDGQSARVTAHGVQLSVMNAYWWARDDQVMCQTHPDHSFYVCFPTRYRFHKKWPQQHVMIQPLKKFSIVAFKTRDALNVLKSKNALPYPTKWVLEKHMVDVYEHSLSLGVSRKF